MGSHHRRVHCCGNCLAGDHDLDRDNWRTDFLRLVREHCACMDCDCTFTKVLIEEPRFDQRHYHPVASRRRRIGTRHGRVDGTSAPMQWHVAS